MTSRHLQFRIILISVAIIIVAVTGLLVVSFQEMTAAIRWISAGTAALIILVVLLGAIWIIRYLKRCLSIPQGMLNELVQGNTKIEAPVVDNELSPIIEAIVQLSSNLQRSSQFAKNIGDGNFEYDFKQVGEQDMLGNSLVQMREKLKNIAQTDKIRNWSASGIAMFADLVRKGGDQQTLSDTLISQLVKYSHSNQGGLYALHQENGQDGYLELTACYAYDRKKYSDKRIEIGSGLVGQCFLEGASINLRQVPNNYVSITSGLGMSTPTSVLIVPLKLNDLVEGVVELASFSHYQQHEIEFVERIAEMIASAISTVRVTDQTKKMLEESQQQSEEMRAQEEEMRQNMEEMQATHEAMQRHTSELKQMQESLEVEKSMFAALMDALPDRITYKDTKSRITRINKAKALRLNMDPRDVIGKTDYDFFAAEHAEKAMREEKALVDSGRPLLDIEELLTFNNGETAWVSSSRIPFKNEHQVMTGMFIISKDITKLKHAEILAVQKTNILTKLFNEFSLIQFSVDKDNRIQNVVAGVVQQADALIDILNGKIIHDVLPHLGKTLRTKTTEVSSVLDTLPDGRSLKQYVFEDKVYIDHFVVVAIVE